MTHTRLTKHPGDRVWAGVCSGIARWLGVDPVLIRLAWLAWAVFGDAGTAVLAYIALMIILPDPRRDERRDEAERRRRLRPAPAHPAGPVPPASPAVQAARPPSASATGPSAAAGAATTASSGDASPSPTADELGDVLLKLLDATAAVAANVARAAVLAVRAAFLTGHATYRATQRPSDARRAGPPPSGTDSAAASAGAPPAPPPATADVLPQAPGSSASILPAASAASATTTGAPIPPEPHIESDEELLQRQIRGRLDAQLTGARTVIAASTRPPAGDRAARRGRLRQLAGFGVLAFGTWGLATTLNVNPLAGTGAALSSLAGAAIVTAAVLIGLGTYLLWTAVRRHP